MNIAGKALIQRDTKLLSAYRLKCNENVSEDVQRTLFEEYWSLEYSKRISYISNLIETAGTKVTRKRENLASGKRNNRSTTNTFHLQIKGERVKVCRGCFMKVYDVSQMFITTAIKTRSTSVSGIPQPANNKYSNDAIIAVVQHIKSFPNYESHYTRGTNDKKYLPPHLNIQKIYSLYCENNSNSVSRKIYSQEFHKLNLRFKVSQVNTYHKCDTFKIKIKSTINLAEKTQLEAELKRHQQLAGHCIQCKKIYDKELAKRDSTIRSFAFDLQQCLPILNSSVASDYS